MKELHDAVYHDERIKEYALQQLKEERKQLIEAPVPPLRTGEFLRIYPFQNMFYEFVHHGNKMEYRAAVKLLKEIADENREEGKIIEKAKYAWDITSRNVTHNAGRLKLKRYLSVMANRKLREKYFYF